MVMTTFTIDSGTEKRMAEYLEGVAGILGNKRRKESFAMYAMGLMGDGERKSAEPIAARACGDPELADACHQRLTHFLCDSIWSDAEVRRFCTRYALEEMTKRETVQAWIIDDTGFLKQGSHSVGVQRQYTGSAGKVTNCQVGASLSITTRSDHVPVDFELYLPESWANDPARRREAHIPKEVTFKKKPRLAIEMIRRAIKDGLPRGVVLADSAYGDSSTFRRELRELELDYAVAVHSPTTVCRLTASGKRRGDPMSVMDVGHHTLRFRKVTWREGTKGKMSSWFASCRVRVVKHKAGGADDEEVWLLMEKPYGEVAPTTFWLATLPRKTSAKRLVRLVKERYRTERVYEDLKGELGLDHFEGRTFRGWHHHVSAVLCCFAFIVAEKARRFPSQEPTTRTTAAKKTAKRRRSVPRRDQSATTPTPSSPHGSPSRGLSPPGSLAAHAAIGATTPMSAETIAM
jgi:SRSO17 transposase